jgi:thiamine-phosphate pyrophosphorylase
LPDWKKTDGYRFRTNPDMADSSVAARLFLVTPPQIDAVSFPSRLAEALAGGEVAAVLIASQAREDVIGALVPLIQNAGAAALVADDTRLAGHVGADGVHVESGIADLRLAVTSFRPKRIVGAGNLHSRHAAMEAGELDVDYLFFGRPHGDSHDEAHPKALDLAEWWSELMRIPAVIMAGRSLDSVAEAASTGADFVALHDAVWSHPGGAAEAIRRALTLLADAGRRAA